MPGQDSSSDEVEAIVTQCQVAREAIGKLALEFDKAIDPREAMGLAWRAGVYRLSVPARFGGLSTGEHGFRFESLMTALLSVSAGDGSVGMMVVTNSVRLRLLFGSGSGLPDDTLQEVADTVLSRETRVVGSNAQPGRKEPVTARRVKGGIVVNGTKLFNTGSHGTGYAHLHCNLENGDAPPLPHMALIPLDDPGITKHDDWDNMGQRATGSQGVTYTNVFVPDGWHHPSPYHPPYASGSLLSLRSAGILYNAAIMLGIGEGAYRAMLDYVRTVNRPSIPRFTSATEDPLMQRRIGENYANLACARALLLQTARAVEHADDDTDMQAVATQGMATKAASVRASLQIADDLFELAGARSTANKYGLDRFWRNARTMACHDSLDGKYVFIGACELSGDARLDALPL